MNNDSGEVMHEPRSDNKDQPFSGSAKSAVDASVQEEEHHGRTDEENTSEDLYVSVSPAAKNADGYTPLSLEHDQETSDYESKTPGTGNEAYGAQKRARFADDMNFEYREKGRRDRSMATHVRRLARKVSSHSEMAIQEIASLADHQTEKSPTEIFARIVLFECILVTGSLLYRYLACGTLRVECAGKASPEMWNDSMSLLVYGGILYCTGPTLTRKLGLVSVATFFLSLFGFAFIGEIRFLKNSLAGSDWYTVPSIFVYILGFCALLGILSYSILIAPTKHDRRLSYYLIAGIIGFFLSGFLVTQFAVTEGFYHVHHYQMAFFGALLLRHPEDNPSTIMRWAILGVFVQGISAYGFDSSVRGLT
eukprot:gb/GECG01015956.1/.p1 GENE.gb/GECG01015956.1/~~gb/GECG01015956.1/.p1  ORF type:complete len:365 (+),score=33.63 gb/GECG01015956.1/:1-1095(+)